MDMYLATRPGRFLGWNLEGIIGDEIMAAKKYDVRKEKCCCLKKKKDGSRSVSEALLRYCVVAFDDMDEVEVLPSSWVSRDEKSAFWPDHLVGKGRHLVAVIRDCVDPEPAWSVYYNIRVLIWTGAYVLHNISCCNIYTVWSRTAFLLLATKISINI